VGAALYDRRRTPGRAQPRRAAPQPRLSRRPLPLPPTPQKTPNQQQGLWRL
jgi:hypothetical protein